MFQFPTTSLWRNCRGCVGFKSPRVNELGSDPIRLPRCVAGAKWGLQLWIVDGEYVVNFSKNPSAVLGNARDDRCAIVLIIFAHFMVITAKWYRWENRSRHLDSNFCNISGTTWRCCCEHICVGEALHRVHCKCSHAETTTPGKESYVCAIIFLYGTGWLLVLLSPPRTPCSRKPCAVITSLLPPAVHDTCDFPFERFNLKGLSETHFSLHNIFWLFHSVFESVKIDLERNFTSVRD